MADWKTYVRAARNTARKQAPAAKDAARRAGDRAGGYVRAAGRAVDEGWREDEPRASAGADERDERREPRSERTRERSSADGRPAAAEGPATDGRPAAGDRPADDVREYDPRGDRPRGHDADADGVERDRGRTQDRDARREREDEHRSSAPADRRSASEGEDRRRPSDRDGGTRTAQRPRPSGEELRREAAAYYAVASRHVERANIFPRIMRALRDALLIGLSLVVIWAVLAAAGIPIPFTTVLIAVGLIVVVSFGAGLYAQWKRSKERLDQAEDPRDR